MSIDIDALKYMEMAIKVMEGSIHEYGDDGKAVPHVGAAIVGPDGNFVEKAYRGEIKKLEMNSNRLINLTI